MRGAEEPQASDMVSPRNGGDYVSPKDSDLMSPRNTDLMSPQQSSYTAKSPVTPKDPLQEPRDDSGVAEVIEGYPPPRPPSQKKKKDIISASEIREADRKASDINVEDFSTMEELTNHITNSISRDVVKARALFSWLCSQKIKEASYNNAERDSPAEALMKMKNGRLSYTSMYTMLCRSADIPCVIIHGYAKSVAYEIGDKSLNNLTNSWNAIYVASAWRLVFPLWACRVSMGRPVKDKDNQQVGVNTTEGVFTDYYFLTDPEEFVYRCFPEKPEWQLTRTPISKEAFLDLPFLRAPFFDRGLKLMTRNSCILASTTGQMDVSIKSLDINMDLLMSCELLYLDEESSKPLSSDIELGNQVAVLNQKSRTTLRVRFPQQGFYQLDVIGGLDTEPDEFSPAWLCSFKLACLQKPPNPTAYPIKPPFGFGPRLGRRNKDSAKRHEDLTLDDPSHKGHTIPIHVNKEVDLKFEITKPGIHVQTKLVSLFVSKDELRQYVKHKILGNKLHINVGVPQNGEYALQIFTRDANDETFDNACSYLLASEKKRNVHEDTRVKRRAYENAAEKRARALLQDSLDSQNPEKMKKAIEKFQEYGLDDGGVIQKAHDKMEYAKLNQALREGILRRNREVLEESISNAKKSEYKDKLKHLTAEAEEVLESVKKVKPFSHDILVLSRKTVSELKTYTHPPSELVWDVMRATYLILGEHRIRLEEWEDIRVLLGRTGKDRLLQRINDFDTDSVDFEALKEANKILRKYTEEIVKSCSVGVGTFYVWCTSILAHFGFVDGVAPPTPKIQKKEVKKPLTPPEPVEIEVENLPEIDDDEYQREQKRLQDKMEYKRLSKALKVGIFRRNIQFLNDALDIVRSSDFTERLAKLIQEAEEVIEEVTRIQKMANKMMELSQQTISELHRYKNPSTAMFDIMKATFIILGEPGDEIKSWVDITNLMRQGSTGNNGLLHRIKSLRTSQVNIEAAKEAAEILNKYSEDKAKTCSAGVQTFYLWCINVLSHFGLMEPSTPKLRIRRVKKVKDPNQEEKIKEKLNKRPKWVSYY